MTFLKKVIYNSDLSTFSTLMSATIYYGDYLHINGEPKSAFYLLKYHGFEDVKRYEINEGANEFSIDAYSDNHLSEICIGHQEVTYKGKTKDIVAVVVRGTNGTIEEWSSNFDIGSTQELSSYHMWNDSWRTDTSSFDYTLNYFLENDVDELNAFADWKTEDNHKGFDIATNRILKYVHCYVDKYVDENTVSYWITGHSRGAAIANLLSAYLIDDGNEVFSYTFASPNTTTNPQWNDARYNSIFNIVNDDDFVPQLPMEDWDFNRYGITKDSISIAEKYEIEWEELTGIGDYDPDTLCFNHTITTLRDIADNGNGNYNRNNCYEFTCNCHGNCTFGSKTTITNYGISESSRNEAKNKIPKNALPYCIIEDTGYIRYNFTVCQTPMYFMQILAAEMGGELLLGNGKGPYDEYFMFLVSINIANRYENAKRAIISSTLGGLEHPHYLESYYVLSKHIK